MLHIECTLQLVSAILPKPPPPPPHCYTISSDFELFVCSILVTSVITGCFGYSSGKYEVLGFL